MNTESIQTHYFLGAEIPLSAGLILHEIHKDNLYESEARACTVHGENLLPDAHGQPASGLKRAVHIIMQRCFYDSERVGAFADEGIAIADHHFELHTIKKIKTLRDFEALSEVEQQAYTHMKNDARISKRDFDHHYAALFGVCTGRLGKKTALYLRDKGLDEVIQILQHIRRGETLGVLRPTVPMDLRVEANGNLSQVFSIFASLKRAARGRDDEPYEAEKPPHTIGYTYIRSIIDGLDRDTMKKVADYFPTNETEFLGVYGELSGGLFTPAFGARRNKRNEGLNPTEWDNPDKIVMNIGLAGIIHVLYGEKIQHASRMRKFGIGLLMVSGELSGENIHQSRATQLPGGHSMLRKIKTFVTQGAWRVSALR